MFVEYLFKDPRFFFAMLISVVVSICLHELGHGLMAIWLGDRTPIEEDRITLSPFVHMGPMSLVCLLLAGIAWGAMPIDPRRLRGKYGPALVAAAGPLTNILLALLALTALGLWERADPRSEEQVSQAIANGRYLLWIFGLGNVLLALFNLLPLPPLDGSRILENFSPSFGHVVSSISHYAPMLLIQMTIIVFSAAGTLIAHPARIIAISLLQAVRGF